jgi:DNA-binding IscR family transcriptional regulator
MLNLEKGGKAFYGTHAYLSDTLGIRYEYLEKCMTNLLKQGLLQVTEEGIKPGRLINFIAKEQHTGLT